MDKKQEPRPKGYVKIRLMLFLTYVLHLLLFGLGRIFLRQVALDVRGAEHVRAIQGSIIFAPNHASVLDPLILCIALARSRLLTRCLPLVSVSREKEFYKGMSYPQPYFYGGLLFKLLGSLEVTPRSVQKEPSSKDPLAMHAFLLSRGFYTLIFPEGAITKTGKILEPKLGAVKLSQKTHTPIIPVAIQGAFLLHPIQFLKGRAAVVTVTFAEPLHPLPEKSSKEQCIKASGEIMRRIATCMNNQKEMRSCSKKD